MDYLSASNSMVLNVLALSAEGWGIIWSRGDQRQQLH